MQGTVKFFDTGKGFGFISPEFGGSDIFVHISAVIASGLDQIREGDFLAFETEQDHRSGRPAAVALILINRGTAPPSPAPPASPPQHGRPPREPAGAGTGRVKWFNAAKGFGFITPDDGPADLFVHITALKRARLDTLEDGQRFAFDVEIDRCSGKCLAINLRPL